MVRACCSTGADNDYKVWWDFVFCRNFTADSYIRITPQVRRNLPVVHRSLVYFFLDLSWFTASRYFIYQDRPALLGHVGFFEWPRSLLSCLSLWDNLFILASSIYLIAFQQTSEKSTCRPILIIDQHCAFCRILDPTCSSILLVLYPRNYSCHLN